MPFLIGVLLASAVGLGAHAIGLDRDRAMYPVVLAVVATYYTLFAVMAGAAGPVLRELVIGVPFLVVLAWGFRTSLWWVVAGLAGHGLLDAVHGQLVANPGMPSWWPAFCGAYDITAAAALGVMLTLPRASGVSATSRPSSSPPGAASPQSPSAP